MLTLYFHKLAQYLQVVATFGVGQYTWTHLGLQDLFRISQSASRGVAISSVKMGMQVLVQSSSDGMEGCVGAS